MSGDLRTRVWLRQMELDAGLGADRPRRSARSVDHRDLLALSDTLVPPSPATIGALGRGHPGACSASWPVLNDRFRWRPGHRDLYCPRSTTSPEALQSNSCRRMGARTVHAVRNGRSRYSRDWGGTRNGTTSCTGTGLTPEEGLHTPSIPPRHRRRPYHSGRGGIPARCSSTGFMQAPLRGETCWGTLLADRRRSRNIVHVRSWAAGIYHNWLDRMRRHRTPWTTDTPPAFDADIWELYGPTTGPSGIIWLPRSG